jgi:hypothetical protein
VAGKDVIGLAIKLLEGTLAIFKNARLVLDFDNLEDTLGCHFITKIYYFYEVVIKI